MTFSSQMFFFSLILLFTSVQVPERAIFRQSQLKCIFELEGDELNSVKWYKNESEFLRYEPKRSPKFKYFPEPGITIN
ncbi:beat protein-like protein, partial [Leptotrombidium deliense]